MKRKFALAAALAVLMAAQAHAGLVIRELWDNVGNGALGDGYGDGPSSVGFEAGTTWFLNFGTYIKAAQNFDVTEGTPDALPGLPFNDGLQGGLWSDEWAPGMDSLWDTRSWATRQLAASAQINFAADGVYWISVRINNGGDSAGGVGLASAGDGTAQFVGVGAMWNNAGGGSANNSLYISDGTLEQSGGPCAIRANSPAGTLNGKGLLVARLTTSAAGQDKLEAAVFKPGETLPADPAAITWQVSYEFNSGITATHLLLWMNGTYAFEIDAIRVATTYGEAAAQPWISAPLAVTPNSTVFAGVPVTLTVGAKGGVPLSFQWRKNGQPVATTSESTLLLASPIVADSGDYDVVISNAAGTVMSAVVTLTIQPANPPTIVQDLVSTTRYVHGRITFSPVIDGTPPFTYAWTHNGTPIAGATGATLSLSDLAAGDGGTYQLQVSNSLGNATTAEATLTIVTPAAGGYAEAIINNKPLAYWRLGESGEMPPVAFDYAGGNDLAHLGVFSNVGVPNASYPGFELGNQAASYDGVTADSASQGPMMNSLTQFTMCGWFNLAAVPQVARTALFGQNDLAEFGFHGDGQLGIWVANASGGTYVGYDQTASLVPGQWYFVACIMDGTKLDMFLDGDYVGSASGSVANSYNSTSPFRIGSATLDATGNYFTGVIDEVALFDRALSGIELNAIYARAAGAVQAKVTRDPVSKTLYQGRTATFRVEAGGTLPLTYKWKKGGTDLVNGGKVSGADSAVLTITGVETSDQGDYTAVVSNAAGSATSLPATLTVVPMAALLPYASAVLDLNPAGYWPLDEATGPAASDYWGGNAGVWGAAAVPGVPGPQSPALAGFSTANTAAQCDGLADSWVQLPALNLNANTITLTAWVYPVGDQGGWKGLIYCRAGTTIAGLNYGSGNELRYVWNGNDANTYNWDSGLQVPLEAWSFVALVIAPTRATMYLGVPGQDLRSAVNELAHQVTAFDGVTYVGQDSQGGRFFTGSMDEVAIYKDALTLDQVQSLFDAAQGIVRVQVDIQLSGGKAILTWPRGVLQGADEVTGTYVDIPDATSPYGVTPEAAKKFYRVKVLFR